MSGAGDPLTPSRAVVLINDLISGTDYQLYLVEFKRKHYGQTEEVKLGRIWYKYWLNFQARNADNSYTEMAKVWTWLLPMDYIYDFFLYIIAL